ncbi:MAG: hypothetical protein ACLFPE_10780 [Bacteroidales bacterium]
MLAAVLLLGHAAATAQSKAALPDTAFVVPAQILKFSGRFFTMWGNVLTLKEARVYEGSEW